MRKEYVQELADLKTKMQKAEKFAEKLPIFADLILAGKITGEEDYLKLGSRYKQIYLNWGITRGFYKKGTSREIMNYRGDDYHGYFFSIYINTCSLFDGHNNFGLYDMMKDADIFFIDYSNSTFYVTDENIESFLEALNTWYIQAAEENKKLRALERLEKAQKEVAKLKEAAGVAS